MAEQGTVVAVYETHLQAEDAVKELQRSGFDLRKLSIVGKSITRRNMLSATTTPATA